MDRCEPCPVYRQWPEEPFHHLPNNHIELRGLHYDCTYQTMDKVNRGRAAMILANRDSNQENDNRSMRPIDFESPKMPESGFQTCAIFRPINGLITNLDQFRSGPGRQSRETKRKPTP